MQFDGYARLKVQAKGWPKPTGTANLSSYDYTNIYRTAPSGEVFRVISNAGFYADNTGRKFWPVISLTNLGEILFFYDDELEGVTKATP
jgi:hypothetical protein